MVDRRDRRADHRSSNDEQGVEVAGYGGRASPSSREPNGYPYPSGGKQYP
ncbi:MAG: hypothetical protein AVDCRST_MAG40-2154 [uncultured Gemmatimonadaceae bacterium]|uniref:Uncharacterized protein n=1 Tax=uncultured Gemmatimonadaceae bacterium TaxID=246130 RepID=A0A6J4LLW1_9BACT|nr:MAG: hypothetical protein AVDCRST_MAG40-2154 [uncultured Gemmatimonadaceae bacterium]